MLSRLRTSPLFDREHLKLNLLHVFFICLGALILVSLGCNSAGLPTTPQPLGTPSLTTQDVQALMAQAVEQAVRLNERVNVAVVDREGNVLGVYNMNNAQIIIPASQALFGEIAKARTAAYTSSNQGAFSTLTGCFITRSHFPPGQNNTPAGPLFGVPFSNRSDSDIQPNGGPRAPLGPPQPPAPGQPGLTNIPGGVPVFKNGLLAGGLGISGGSDTFIQLNTINDRCVGVLRDEMIALGALGNYAAPASIRGDNVFLDGIQLLYSNQPAPPGNFTFTFDSLAARGSVNANFPVRATPPANFPPQGYVAFADGSRNYNPISGQVLTAADVQQIITNAANRASNTRAAIRRPIGSAAQVFICVADLDGTILGMYRTADATMFSYDVAAQKARTSVAFSAPNDGMGIILRTILNVPNGAPLAASTRAVGFLSQRFFPPGIDQGTGPRTQPPEMGPLYTYVDGQFDFQYMRLLPPRPPFQNGIQIFAGGIPLYKNGVLAGGIGVSGDGVDQDDYIAAGGTLGFEAPANIRTDQYRYNNTVLPYMKFPRQPNLK